MSRPWVVGLTGGIGSGKSTVAAMLAGLGVPVLDLDAVGHAVLEDTEVRGALKAAFGPEVLAPDGTPDRQRLGEVALATAEGAQRLGAIMHPPIWRRAEAWLARQHTPYALIEASVLIESGSVDRVDHVVAVLADLELRRRRVAQRLTAADFARVVARQCSDAERRRLADRLLVNEGDLEQLERDVTALHTSLLAAAGEAAR